jgi:hypothetical protein
MPEGELVPGDENSLADAIRKAIGAGPYEKVMVATPQFDRIDGKVVTFKPESAEQLDGLKANAPDWALRDIGMGMWEETKDDQIHWLFPAEWYESIPKGYEIVDINGLVEKFEPGKTDDDRRGGMLAYGWIRPKKDADA